MLTHKATSTTNLIYRQGSTALIMNLDGPVTVERLDALRKTYEDGTRQNLLNAAYENCIGVCIAPHTTHGYTMIQNPLQRIQAKGSHRNPRAKNLFQILPNSYKLVNVKEADIGPDLFCVASDTPSNAAHYYMTPLDTSKPCYVELTFASKVQVFNVGVAPGVESHHGREPKRIAHVSINADGSEQEAVFTFNCSPSGNKGIHGISGSRMACNTIRIYAQSGPMLRTTFYQSSEQEPNQEPDLRPATALVMTQGSQSGVTDDVYWADDLCDGYVGDTIPPMYLSPSVMSSENTLVSVDIKSPQCILEILK